jgi:hypothetical protein
MTKERFDQLYAIGERGNPSAAEFREMAEHAKRLRERGQGALDCVSFGICGNCQRLMRRELTEPGPSEREEAAHDV